MRVLEAYGSSLLYAALERGFAVCQEKRFNKGMLSLGDDVQKAEEKNKSFY